MGYWQNVQKQAEQKAALKRQRTFRTATRGTGACPKCGSTSFKAKRSAGAKLGLGITVGVGALLAPKTRVKCTGCGLTYLRG